VRRPRSRASCTPESAGRGLPGRPGAPRSMHTDCAPAGPPDSARLLAGFRHQPDPNPTLAVRGSSCTGKVRRSRAATRRCAARHLRPQPTLHPRAGAQRVKHQEPRAQERDPAPQPNGARALQRTAGRPPPPPRPAPPAGRPPGPRLAVAQQRARERHQLLLARAQRRAALAQHQVQAERRRLGHARQVRAPQRRPALRVAVLAERRQVEAQRAREEHRHLRAGPRVGIAARLDSDGGRSAACAYGALAPMPTTPTPSASALERRPCAPRRRRGMFTDSADAHSSAALPRPSGGSRAQSAGPARPARPRPRRGRRTRRARLPPRAQAAPGPGAGAGARARARACGMMAMDARSCSTPSLAMLTPSMTMAPLSSSCGARGVCRSPFLQER